MAGPGQGQFLQPFHGFTAQSVVNEAQAAMHGYMVEYSTAAFRQVLDRYADEIAGSGNGWLNSLERALSAGQIPAHARQRGWQQVGDRARRSMVASYTHRAHRRGLPSYRPGATSRKDKTKRFAGGVLRRALNRPEMVLATPHGLSFINTEILDKEAVQWRRLNFGAGAGSDGGLQAPGQFGVRWNGLVVFAMGLEPDVRAHFKIPRGIWFDGGQAVEPSQYPGQHQFFTRRAAKEFLGENTTHLFKPSRQKGKRVGKLQKAKTTSGIAASNFLDGGVRRVAKEIGPMFFGLYEDFFNSGVTSFEDRRSVTVDVKPPTAIKQGIARSGFVVGSRR